MNVACVVDAKDELGEGPCWSDADRRLYWFDIQGRRLAWFDPESRMHGCWPLSLRASAAAPLAGGGLIVATERGLARTNAQGGSLELVEPMDLGPGFRSNDGKIDIAGRFWWSRMDDEGGARPGGVYRTDPGAATVPVLEGIHIPNTLACSPDGGTFYLADSKRNTLLAYDLAPDGSLSRGRPFAACEPPVTPDGSAVDAEGCLWNAQWGGWRIVRYTPDGRVDRVVPMPVEQPTSCAFGGPGLATLYVTSARSGLSDEHLARQPKAGGLFALDPGVRGLQLPAFECGRPP